MEQAWQEFEQAIKASSCANLYPGSNLVIGRGSKTPKVVFIGEAPGAEEDRLKLPFVGRSGKLLDKWIAYLGLTDEFYITNVVKYRPPNNRDPTPDEIAACAPFLEKQMQLLNPRYVIAVGRFAMNFFFPKKKGILRESGKLIDGKYFIVPHPSYFLRNGGTGWEAYLDPLVAELQGKPAKQEKQQTLF